MIGFRRKAKLINRRVIVSGRIIEFYEYEKPIFKGEEKRRVGRAGAPFSSEETKHDNRRKVASRARATVRRIINANPQLNKFFTLTFAENVTDLYFARYEFDKFTKRLKTLYKGFQYVVVVEFQKRGAVHFHLLCNLPYTPADKLQALWGHGFVKINRIDKVDNVGAYVTKYMTKDGMDERLTGRKCYSMSKGLKKPTEYTDENDCEEIFCSILDRNAEDKDSLKRYIKCKYETEHYGIITYTQYVFDRPLKTPNKLRQFINNVKSWLTPIKDDTPSPF